MNAGGGGLITTATYRSAEDGNQIVGEIKVLGRDGEEFIGSYPAGRIIWGSFSPGQGWTPVWLQSLQYTGGVTFEDFQIPGWLITLRDGTRYKVMRQVVTDNSESGIPNELGPPALDEIREPNGNRLKFVREWDIASGRSKVLRLQARGAGVLDGGPTLGPGVEFSHDGEGRVTKLEVSDGVSTWETRYAYDALGNLATVLDAEGNSTQFLYGEGGAPPHYLTSIVDPLGRTGVRNEYDDDGRLVAHVDAKGNRIEFDHDLVGRIEEVTDRSGAVTTIFYDEQGREVSKLDPDPGTGVGRLLTTYEYADPGNPRRETKITVAPGPGGREVPGQTHTSHLTYNGSGDLIERRESIMVFDVETNTTSTQEVVERTDYDTNGNPIRTTDPRGFVTRTLLGPANRPERSIQEGLPGTTSDDIVTTNFYDGAGRLMQTTGPTGVRQRFEYSEEGWLLRSWTVMGSGEPADARALARRSIPGDHDRGAGLPCQPRAGMMGSRRTSAPSRNPAASRAPVRPASRPPCSSSNPPRSSRSSRASPAWSSSPSCWCSSGCCTRTRRSCAACVRRRPP